MDHARRFSWCRQRRQRHEAGWELGVFMVIWLALNMCNACLTSELQALLNIRRMLAEDNEIFSSWDVSTDCCRNWRGISCDGGTGAVSLLQLETKGDNPLRFREFPAAVCNLTELRGIIITGASFQSGGFAPCLWNMTLEVLNMSRSYVPRFNWEALFHSNSSLEVLDLTNSALTGSLDGVEFGEESRLRFLSLRSNQLSGKIPQGLSRFRNLISLDLGNNTLKGQIPEWFGNMSKLEELKLDFNKLTGKLPASLGNLTTLHVLDLAHNSLSRNIPDALMNLRTDSLGLQSNRLSGPVPIWLRNMTTIRSLNISRNRLSGTIPERFFSWNITLDLSHNHFTGTIHPFENSSELNLSNNNLTGNIPSPSGNRSFIRVIDFSFNLLTGGIFALEGYNSLHRIILSSNRFGGSIPAFLFSWNVTLDLSHNHFTGTIHPFEDSSELYLSNNNLTGNIPSPSGNRSSISVIDFSFNKLTGSIFALEGYNSLHRINLTSNRLGGRIPAFLNLYNLEVLHLGSNQFNGSIPSSLGSVRNLQYLKLSTNQLTGLIPDSLGNLANLSVLDLSGNRLSGEIPPSFVNLTEAVQLKLQNNSLRGHIPAFCNKGGNHQLRSLSLGHNRLYGKIPPTFHKCEQLYLLDLSNNRLTGRFNFTPTLRVLLVGSNNLGGKLTGTLARAENLQILDISDNRFRGKIPKKLDNLEGFLWNQTRNSEVGTLFEEDISFVVKGTRLQFTYVLTMRTSINLSFNNFTGSIPDQFGLLLGLQQLNLSGNSLTGKIPKDLQNINLLESLDLSGNHLTGRIPEELINLRYLSVVNFSGNRLSGPIPTGGQFGTFTRDAYENNQGLCGVPMDPCGGPEETIAVSVQSPEFTQGFKLGFCVGFSFICVIGSAYFYFSSFQDLVSKCLDSVCLRRVMDLLRYHCFQVSNSQVSDEPAASPQRVSCNGTRQDDEAHISRWAYGSASG